MKSNIGHTLTAAGSRGLLKVLLALQHGLASHGQLRCAASEIGLRGKSFRVLAEHRPEQTRRLAAPCGRSAFGFGGINAHVLLEECGCHRTIYFTTGGSIWRASSRRAGFQLESPTLPSLAWAPGSAMRDLRAFQERVLGRDDDEPPELHRHWWGVEASDSWTRRFGTAKSVAGYYLNELELPLDRFRIPPKEMEDMLPQQLLMLAVAAEAIADCRFRSDRLATGVFIGLGLDCNTTNFHLRWSLRRRAKSWAQEWGWQLSDSELERWLDQVADGVGPPLTANRTMGALGGIVASRIAREFHIGGPSFTIPVMSRRVTAHYGRHYGS